MASETASLSGAAVEQTSGNEESEDPGGICVIPPAIKLEDEDVTTKLSPTCLHRDMKLEAMSAEEIQKLCFLNTFSLIEAQLGVVPGLTGASFGSHSTSSASEKSMYSSLSSDDDIDVVLTELMKKSASINSRVTSITVSRQGRSTQRWIVDTETNQIIRLVTGCVPILEGGKIMMVSSNKKNEWILPKGGWEIDEDAEESAIRESFEEAGVLGILGPKLSEVQFENRKARERRLIEDGNLKSALEAVGQFSSGWSDVSQLSEDDHLFDKDHSSTSHHNAKASPETPKKPKVQVTIQPIGLGKALDVPRQDKNRVHLVPPEKQVDPKDHISSEAPLEYTHVRMSLFPLYVQEVKTEWPESGRLRRAVDIEEAIELLEGRPELRTILLEVKEKGMHLV